MKWNIYTITSETENLTGVKLRGRIRKFGIQNNITVHVENAQDIPDAVRFALPSKECQENLTTVCNYIRSLANIHIEASLLDVTNPVLSKLKCNDEKRYEI